MLSEDSNLTLESVARIFHALGDRCVVKSEHLESIKGSLSAREGAYWRSLAAKIDWPKHLADNSPGGVGRVGAPPGQSRRMAPTFVAQAANRDQLDPEEHLLVA